MAKKFTKKFKLIQAESDRDAVLVTASMREDSLQSLIIAKLVPNLSKKDLLFSIELRYRLNKGVNLYLSIRTL